MSLGSDKLAQIVDGVTKRVNDLALTVNEDNLRLIGARNRLHYEQNREAEVSKKIKRQRAELVAINSEIEQLRTMDADIDRSVAKLH